MKLVPISEVTPSTYNPRQADPRRLDILELSLRKLGWLLPIFADRNGEILSGHQRHHVAQRIGLTHVPVVFTEAMDLATRKAINVAFNRGTNDLSAAATPRSITDALGRIDLPALAAAVPDRDPAAPDFARCLTARPEPIGRLLEANRGRWVPYARNMARMLRARGIEMPVVCTPDGQAVNGIGRLQLAAELRQEAVPVVWISPQEAALSNAMLNLLSMDFDLHNRYADLLRYNSFRRARRVRDYLGRGFVFAVIGREAGREFDIREPASLARWKAVHGSSVLDFGAGHLHETELLRSVGIHVTPFEPFRVPAGGAEIDRAASIDLAVAFLAAVADGHQWSSVFISSVLNSVPFAEDRAHIACICAALCGPRTKLYAVASSVRQAGHRQIRGAGFLNETHHTAAIFALDYEPGIQLGDFQEKPKVQKYHTQAEFYGLFKPFFNRVQVTEATNNVQAVCAEPRPVDPERLMAALRFEFNLPYPDGSRMGLVDQAVAAFRARGIPL